MHRVKSHISQAGKLRVVITQGAESWRRVGADCARQQRGFGGGDFHFLPSKLHSDKVTPDLPATGIKQFIASIFRCIGKAGLSDAISRVEGVLQRQCLRELSATKAV